MATEPEGDHKFRLLRRLRIDQTYLDGLPVAFCVSDVIDPSQPMLFASTGFEQLTGYALSETIGRNCNFLQGPHTDMKTRGYLARAIAEARGVTVVILNYRRDRRRYWNMLKMEPLRSSNTSTQPRYFVGIQVDVTDYLSARPQQLYGNDGDLPPVLPQFAAVMKAKPEAMETAIRGVASSLALSAPPMIQGPNGGRLPVFFGPPTFVDGIPGLPSGFVISDARQKGLPLVFASDGFLAMTGYTVEEALGRNCKYLQGRDTAKLTVDELRSAIRESRAITRVVLNYRRDGTPFYNMLTIAPVLGRESARRLARRLRRAQRKFLSEVARRGADPSTLAAVKQGMALANGGKPESEDDGPVPIMSEAGLRLPDAIINLNIASDDEQDDLEEDARRLAHKSPDQGLKPLYYIGLQIDVSDYPDLIEPPEAGGSGEFVIQPDPTSAQAPKRPSSSRRRATPRRPESTATARARPSEIDVSARDAGDRPRTGGQTAPPMTTKHEPPASPANLEPPAPQGPIVHTLELEATSSASVPEESGRQRTAGDAEGEDGPNPRDTRPEARRMRAMAEEVENIEQVYDSAGRPASPDAYAVFGEEGEDDDDFAAMEADIDGQLAEREAEKERVERVRRTSKREGSRRKRAQRDRGNSAVSQGTTRSTSTSEDDKNAKRVASQWLRKHGMTDLAEREDRGPHIIDAAEQQRGNARPAQGAVGMDVEGTDESFDMQVASSLSSSFSPRGQGTVVPPTVGQQGGPAAAVQTVNTASPYRRERRPGDDADAQRHGSEGSDKEKCTLQ